MKKIRYNRVSIVLDEQGISQRDLALLLGGKGEEMKDKISGWCTNRHQPSIQTLYKIAYVLRINIQSLLEPTNWEGISTPSPLQALKDKKNKNRAANKKTQKKSHN